MFWFWSTQRNKTVLPSRIFPSQTLHRRAFGFLGRDESGLYEMVEGVRALRFTDEITDDLPPLIHFFAVQEFYCPGAAQRPRNETRCNNSLDSTLGNKCVLRKLRLFVWQQFEKISNFTSNFLIVIVQGLQKNIA